MNGFNAGLPSLLNALRGAGLRIGVAETLQLREVLAEQAAHDVDELRRVLAAVLVKSTADRAVLDRLFFTWRDGREAAAREFLASADASEKQDSDIGETVALPEADPAPGSAPAVTASRRRQLFLGLTLAALAIVLLASTLAVWLIRPPEVAQPVEQSMEASEIPPGGIEAPVSAVLPATPPPSQFAEPPSNVGTEPKPQVPWPWILFTGGLALAGVGFWWLSLVRAPKAPALPPQRPGPQRIRIRVPRPPQDLQLLDLEEEHDLVSGIGRYVSDAATEQLDLAATVDATAAAAGIPRLRFQFSEEHHCVRLWLDRSATDPQLERLAADVTGALHRSGLPVEQAFFWGVPSHLSTPDGVACAANEIDEWRSRSLVLVFTDGTLLGQLFHAGGRRLEIDACLRALARWPRLTFVDFGQGDCLQALLDRNQIPSVRPRQVPELLSENAQTVPSPEDEEWGELEGDVQAWAAVCALGPEPVDDETALALRRVLGLKAGPWELATLRHAATNPASRSMVWRGRRRAQLLRWLCQMEEIERDGQIRADCLLYRAVAAWDSLYRFEAERHQAEEPHNPWRETAAARRVELCRALLELWIDPDRAVPKLYHLHRSAEWRPSVRRELGALLPAEPGETRDVVALAWRFNERPPKIQSMLLAMGFGTLAGFAARRRLQPQSAWAQVVVALWAVLLMASGYATLYKFLRSVDEVVENRSGQLLKLQTPVAGTFSTYDRAIISPDGKKLAYTSDHRLRLLQSDRPELLLIPESEEAVQPFWSPQSDYIAYRIGKTIFKVPIDGGLATRICELPYEGFIGGTWGPADEIVFHLSQGGFLTAGIARLYRVSARGGDPELLLEPDQGEGGIWYPTFLPDGESLLASIRIDSGQYKIVIVLPDRKIRHIFTVDLDIAWLTYDPAGYILYQRSIQNADGIWAIPFSIDTMTVQGELFLIAQDGASPSVSTDGSLAYILGNTGRQRLVQFDRTGKRISEIGTPQREIADPAFSPDGRFVAVRGTVGRSEDIWIHEVESGRPPLRLTDHPDTDDDPSWSPNGDQLVFDGDRTGSGDLYTVDVFAGGKIQALTETPFPEDLPNWSPDGRYIVYTIIHADRQHDIWYYDMQGDGEPQPFIVTNLNETEPQISPDGRYLAYQADVLEGQDIYLTTFPEVGAIMPVSSRGGRFPRWGERSNELFYIESSTGDLMAVKIANAPDVTIGQAERLFSIDTKQINITNHGYYDVAPDGESFAVVQPEGAARFLIVLKQNWLAEFEGD